MSLGIQTPLTPVATPGCINVVGSITALGSVTAPTANFFKTNVLLAKHGVTSAIINSDIIIFMTPQDWAALILSIASIFAIVAGGIRWLVKHYLNELKPNSGSSLKDSVNRLEEKTDKLFDLFVEHIKDHNKK